MYVHACRCGDHPEKSHQIENAFFAHPSVVSITSGMNSLFQRPSMQMSGRFGGAAAVRVLDAGYLADGLGEGGEPRGFGDGLDDEFQLAVGSAMP